MNIRMGWQACKNPAMSTLHCDCLLPCVDTYEFLDDDEEPNELQQSLAGIHGVVGVTSDKYSLGVEKGEVFSWSEIKPRVEDVVRQWAGADKVDRVEVTHPQ